MFWLDDSQLSPLKVSNSLALDTILAPDSEKEDNQIIKQAEVSTVNPSKPLSSGSSQHDLPSWTMFSNASSEAEDEIILSPSKKGPMNKQTVREGKTASHTGVIQPQPAALGSPPHTPIPVTPNSKAPATSPPSPSTKRTSGITPRSSFVGVVIPIRRPWQSDSPHIEHARRKTHAAHGIASSGVHTAEMDTESDVIHDPGSGSGADNSPASNSGTNNLLSALTNTFEKNRYVEADTPSPSPRLVDPLPVRRTLVSKATEVSNAGTSSRGILKVYRPVPLRQTDIDVLLGTNVAPMRVNEKCNDGERRRRATRMNVRFLLEGIAVDGAETVDMREQSERSNGHREKSAHPSGDGHMSQPSYTKPRPSQTSMFVERLETMFGPGNNNHGTGNKPKKVSHLPQHIIMQAVFMELDTQLRKETNGRWSSKFASTAPTTSASVSSMSRSHSPLSEVVSTGASSLDAEIDPVQLGKRMRELEDGSDEQQIPHTTVIIQPPVNTATANDWTTALQRLNKGKTTLGREVCVCP
jgi:hypothetical protein